MVLRGCCKHTLSERNRVRSRVHNRSVKVESYATLAPTNVLQSFGFYKHALLECISVKVFLRRTIMEESAIFDKIKDVVADKLDADPQDIKEDAAFVDDLGADSLDVVELIMGLEDEFEIEISDEDAEKIRTVGDAVKFISSQT